MLPYEKSPLSLSLNQVPGNRTEQVYHMQFTCASLGFWGNPAINIFYDVQTQKISHPRNKKALLNAYCDILLKQKRQHCQFSCFCQSDINCTNYI